MSYVILHPEGFPMQLPADTTYVQAVEATEGHAKLTPGVGTFKLMKDGKQVHGAGRTLRLDQLTRRQREILITAARREGGGRPSERIPRNRNAMKPYQKLIDAGLAYLDFRAVGSFHESGQPEFKLRPNGCAMVAALRGRV